MAVQDPPIGRLLYASGDLAGSAMLECECCGYQWYGEIGEPCAECAREAARLVEEQATLDRKHARRLLANDHQHESPPAASAHRERKEFYARVADSVTRGLRCGDCHRLYSELLSRQGTSSYAVRGISATTDALWRQQRTTIKHLRHLEDVGFITIDFRCDQPGWGSATIRVLHAPGADPPRLADLTALKDVWEPTPTKRLRHPPGDFSRYRRDAQHDALSVSPGSASGAQGVHISDGDAQHDALSVSARSAQPGERFVDVRDAQPDVRDAQPDVRDAHISRRAAKRDALSVLEERRREAFEEERATLARNWEDIHDGLDDSDAEPRCVVCVEFDCRCDEP